MIFRATLQPAYSLEATISRLHKKLFQWRYGLQQYHRFTSFLASDDKNADSLQTVETQIINSEYVNDQEIPQSETGLIAILSLYNLKGQE